MTIADWFLSKAERGNPATRLDERHPGQQAWSTGNRCRPLIHGATYFAELYERIEQMGAGDLLLFTDWRGDQDERLTGEPGSEVGTVLSRASHRGVDVRGLVWRSHSDKLKMGAGANRDLAEDIEDDGGEMLLDLRVRPAGSHHQKFVVLRHPGRPERDIAYVGGIDLCHTRRDDADHGGDPQVMRMSEAYGASPAWHDAQLAITGPAVADVETVFRERWDDPAALSRNPFRMLRERLTPVSATAAPLPRQEPAPAESGPHTVQLLRTYPNKHPGYPFAPTGERSVARGYAKAIDRAQRLIYLEDQFLWSEEVAHNFADVLRQRPELHVVAVLPHHPGKDSPLATVPNRFGRQQAMGLIEEIAGDRVHLFGIENHAGAPVYVHAKVCVIDDTWASIGSDNFNRRSWTHDSELSAVVWDTTPEPAYARDLRRTLAREHLDRRDGEDDDLADPHGMVAAFDTAAAALQQWHDGGRTGPRPPGRLRPLEIPRTSRAEARWAATSYRVLNDPDGRPRSMRPRGRLLGPLQRPGRF